MRTEGDDFVLTPADFVATAQALCPQPGPLSVLPPIVAGGMRVDGGLSAGAREHFARLVRAFADPAKSGRLHQAVADESISRVALAWHAGLDGIATLASVGAEVRLGLRSAESLRLMVSQILALDSVGDEGLQRVALGTPACLAWLAVLDHLRRARLVALLRHVAPVEVFSAGDIVARFTASQEEDFRWPLNFVARLAPLPLHELDVARDPLPALGELEAAHLVERVSGADATATFELSPGGTAEADAILHDVSKVGLEVTQVTTRGVVTDVALLVRPSLRLHLFYLSAGESAFGGLTGLGADNLLGHLLVAPEVPAAATASPAARPSIISPALSAHEPEAQVTGTLVRPPAASSPSKEPVAVTGTLVRPPSGKVPVPPVPETGELVRPPSLGAATPPGRPAPSGPPTPGRRPTPAEPVTLPPSALRSASPPRPTLPTEPETLPPVDLRSKVPAMPVAPPAPVPTGLPATEGIVQLRPLLLALERVGAPPLMITLEDDATIGRTAENRIALDDSGASRRHASIRRTEDGAWEIEDLLSSNGTLVNDQRIIAPTVLSTGDRIRISRSLLRVEKAPAPVGRRSSRG